MTTEGTKRKLAAILSADVKEYSRLMSQDERGTIRTLTAYKEAISSLIQEYKGRVVDAPGDNLLAEFGSVVDAVNCAVEIQRELSERNADLPPARQMEFRIGINIGDIVEEEKRIYGDGVNIAARVESLAEGGGGLEYEFLGEQEVKNIAEPVPAYRVLSFPGAAAHRVVKAKKAVRRSWRNTIIVIVAVLVVGAAVAVWHFYFRPPPIEVASVEKMAFPLPDNPSIAVLPFVNMSGDPNQEYLSDGFTEQIITGLSMLPRVFVIARNSTFTYKGKAVKVQQVAEELGVRYVLEGGVQKAGEKVRITAQLIDAITGHHLWADRYDRDLKDIFALQDEITMKIMSAIGVKLTRGQTARLAAKGTDNVEAYIKHMQGQEYFYRSNKDSNLKARKLYEEAIALDPEYPNAYASLGWTHFMDAFLGSSKSPRKSFQEAAKLAQKSIALDKSIVTPRGLLAMIYGYQRQYEKAIAQGERGVAIAPNIGFSHYYLGLALFWGDRKEEAVQSLEKAIRLDPKGMGWYFNILALAYSVLGRYEEAIATYKKAIDREPDFRWGYIGLAATYTLAGREEEGRAAAAEVLRIEPKFSLDYYAKIVPWKNKADLERWVAALRKAGLPEKPPIPLPDKPSIAVLPFVNMSGDPEQEYFSDGITEEIITALSKVPDLFVIARNSSFTYKGKSVRIPTVGRELGVRYVLEGSVRKAGEKVRVTAQLVDAKTGNHLWAERYDRELKDIFALQDEITMKIVAAMELKLTEGETARLHVKGTDNLEAYIKYLQANFYLSRWNPEDNARARPLAEEVIGLDPEYPAAYRLLALTHMNDVFYGSSKDKNKSIRQSIKLAQKALSMDDSDPLSHYSLGRIYSILRQYEKAIVELNQALNLNPNLVDANAWLALVLNWAGRPEEALPLVKKARRLSPVAKRYGIILGQTYQRLGRYEEAIEPIKENLHYKPNHFFGHHLLAVSYVALNREQEARAEAAEAFRINPNYSVGASESRWPTSGP
jgi:adenylate cyclase